VLDSDDDEQYFSQSLTQATMGIKEEPEEEASNDDGYEVIDGDHLFQTQLSYTEYQCCEPLFRSSLAAGTN